MLPMQMQQQATASCVHGMARQKPPLPRMYLLSSIRITASWLIGKYDVNAGVGDLYYYDGKDRRKLDTGITAIFIY